MTDDERHRSGFAMTTPLPPTSADLAGRPPRGTAAVDTSDPGTRARADSTLAESTLADSTLAKDALADDALVDLAAERTASDVDAVLDRLDRDLVGLAPVKQKVRQIAALLLVDRVRQRYQLTTQRPSLHMCFTGSPGTGKTTVALRMADLLHRMGYIRRNHLVAVTRDDLVGQYIGHTAPKTREVLKRAMGGVLFIDEAYYLYRAENERDYGQETIEILLQAMENDRDDLVVILAGYKDRMDSFFSSNPGMSSRVAHHLDFPDYTADELLAIARLMVDEQGYVLSPAAEVALAEYLRRRMAQPRFANARSVRNAIERARLRHADRLVGHGGRVSRHDLMCIDAPDIMASRVFTDTEVPDTPAPQGDPAPTAAG